MGSIVVWFMILVVCVVIIDEADMGTNEAIGTAFIAVGLAVLSVVMYRYFMDTEHEQ